MKDYYDILDVPLNASIEQIKSRYKQLVRIYHPDRFSNALDKVYAEHKLKQVNEAYAFLTSDTEGMTFFNTIAVPPEPVVEPAVLDFGVLRHGDQQILRFEVANSGGPASGVTFVCSEENSWFRVSNGRRLDPAKTLPMVFEVVADIRPNFPAQHYAGWIEISMGGVKTRVQLAAEIQEGQTGSTFQMPAWQLPTWQLPSFHMRSRLLALVGVFCVVALLLNLRFPQAVVDFYHNLLVTRSALLVSAASEPGAIATHVPPTALPVTATVMPVPVTTIAVATIVVEPTVTAEIVTPPLATATPVPAEEVVSPAQERAALLPAVQEELPPGAAEATIAALSLDSVAEAVVSDTTPAATATTALPTPTATVPPTAMPLPTATTAPTDTPVPAPTATALSTATATPLPTATATVPPSKTALPVGGLYEILLADGSTRQALTLEIPQDHTVNVRFSWDIRSPAVAVLVGGTQIPAVGRSIDNTWVQVALPDGQLGWIFAEVINADLTQIEQLPPTLAPQWP